MWGVFIYPSIIRAYVCTVCACVCTIEKLQKSTKNNTHKPANPQKVHVPVSTFYYDSYELKAYTVL